jgi:hypothetical protein
MARIFDPLDQQIRELPLWAENLVAARMVRRAAMAHFGDDASPLREKLMAALDTMEDCSRTGQPSLEQKAQLEAAYRLRDNAEGSEGPLLNALYYAADSTLAADAAQDFPIDGTVAMSALRAVDCLQTDRRFSALQIRIVLASDVDLLRFSCETGVAHRYIGLGADVVNNLPPMHPLTLLEVKQKECDRR